MIDSYLSRKYGLKPDEYKVLSGETERTCFALGDSGVIKLDEEIEFDRLLGTYWKEGYLAEE